MSFQGWARRNQKRLLRKRENKMENEEKNLESGVGLKSASITPHYMIALDVFVKLAKIHGFATYDPREENRSYLGVIKRADGVYMGLEKISF